MGTDHLRAHRVGRYELGRYDHVTLLPNRQAFLEDTADPAPAARIIALVTLADPRTFNEITRALGHQTAEDFVRNCAARIAAALGEHVPLYHVSALGFAFRVDPNRAETVAAGIARAFRVPILCEGIPIDARVGVGLHAVSHTRGTAPEDLRAALAAAQDSRARPDGWAWYDKGSDDAHRRAFRLLTDIKGALDGHGQLALHYQPKVALCTGATHSAEALLRWEHPELGPIAPSEFVPLVEATALVTPLTRWVISAAIAELARWRRQGLPLGVAVNISPKNLVEPDFVEHLTFCCAAAGVPTGAVELEITEGMAATEGRLMLARLATLRGLGFSIAIDDFGSGYSNMSYLTRLSAGTLKLDRSLLAGLHESDTPKRLIAGIVKMGRDLGYQLVAEGVETDADRVLLRRMGVDQGQGWLFAKAQPANDFLAWLAGRAASALSRRRGGRAA
jgi:EAL domain-containing protein (putative c-di-GMP-specific phosphodiesterase class I)